MQVVLEKWDLAQVKRFGRSSKKWSTMLGPDSSLEHSDMYAECFNEAEATVNGTPPDQLEIEKVIVTAYKRNSVVRVSAFIF